MSDGNKSGRHQRTAAVLACVGAAMLAASFAAVPVYRLICEATGLNGTTQRVSSASSRVSERTITVHFDANTAGGMAWQFGPEQRQMTVRLGETSIGVFRAHNPTDRTITGSATFNVTPEIAGRYFDKIQCFCFDLQTLAAGETAEMQVVFYVDPDIVKEPGAEDIHDITLSYTFFESPQRSSAAAVPVARKGT